MESSIRAYVSLPSDCMEMMTKLIERIGGKVLAQEDSDTVIAPPIPERERPGRMVRGLRAREGMTQAELAEAIGVPQSHISAWENFTRPIPRDKAEALAKALHSVPENFIA